jgi:hypothetical protein
MQTEYFPASYIVGQTVFFLKSMTYNKSGSCSVRLRFFWSWGAGKMSKITTNLPISRIAVNCAGMEWLGTIVAD